MLSLNGTPGFNGGTVSVLDAAGTRVAGAAVFGSDGRGGQHGLVPRFALAPGAYRVEVRGGAGTPLVKDITVTGSPLNVRVQ